MGWITAVVIVLAANGVGWLCAAINRGGEPDAVVVLTERELPLAPREQEDTGVALELSWQGEWSGHEWLDAKKMEQIGFDPAVIGDVGETEPPYWKLSSRRAYVVLALVLPDDPVPAAGEGMAVSETEETEPSTDDLDSRSGSRLFVIDAGPNPEELRRLHPDRSRQIIVPATIGVRAGFTEADEAAVPGMPDPFRRYGVIARLLVQRIHVPRSFHSELAPALENPTISASSSRYQVTLAFGRRFEPWIRAVEVMEP
jgi:hypothetical protein